MTNRFGEKFKLAYCDFYKTLNYKMGINLKSRHTKRGDPKKKYIDLLTQSELKGALKIVVSMCEKVGIDSGMIIQEHTTPEIVCG